MRLECFFDCSSPWTYLGFERVIPLAEEYEIDIEWRPILVGGIFNAVNPGVEFFKKIDETPKRKIDYMLKDMQDWSRLTGLKIAFPPAGHPVNSVKAMRACLVLQETGQMVPFARACFQAYFGEEKSLADDAVLTEICQKLDIDAPSLLDRIAQQDVKDALRANVDEAIERGAFGSPTFYVNGDDMYFGVDRLQLVRARLEELSRQSA